MAVNKTKLVRLVEELTGEKLVYLEDLEPELVEDWDENQQALAAQREQEIAEALALLKEIQARNQAKIEAGEVAEELEPEPDIPAPYTPKPMPQWVADRVKKAA